MIHPGDANHDIYVILENFILIDPKIPRPNMRSLILRIPKAAEQIPLNTAVKVCGNLQKQCDPTIFARLYVKGTWHALCKFVQIRE